MQRRILVVDDSEITRDLLRKMLCADYEVLQAESGAQALAILREEQETVCAVLLDIIMPQMDGYAVLEKMRSDPVLASIPVIVATGTTDVDAEDRAFSLGANDFVTKPYNPITLRHRLWNIINLRETAATARLALRDDLTGLLTRRAFFEKAAAMISRHSPGYYVMASFDVDSFKVVNDQYGTARGDEVLRFVADAFAEGFGPVGGICCRIMADKFAMLYPRSFMDSAELTAIRGRLTSSNGTVQPLTFSVGRYIVDDLSLPVSGMYDRATMAQISVKGRFDANTAVYDESMRINLLREQEIIGEMEGALESGQFEVWFQPQYNHTTGALIGAEALVRWRHPQRGLIPPGSFVPVFERNGFIYELDKFVWERVCAFLRKWIDEGRAPLPVSVNISRYDVFRKDLIDVITGLVARYNLPVELLRLEITESAFAKSTGQIISVVKQLIEYGFIMEIDDFGSGYSSLNTLKDVPAHVLKLDMRFLESSQNSDRGGNVLESIVRMARWLGMSVIAEGVESREQADYLESIGCNYVQGYLYARPMSAGDFEAIERDKAKEERMMALETVATLDNSAFWDPKSMDTLIFNSFVGGACIFEFHNGKAELLRANRKYAHVLGGLDMTLEEALKLSWHDHIAPESRAAVLGAVRQAIDTDDEAACEALFLNLTKKRKRAWFRLALRVIARTGEHFLFYCTNEDITAQKEGADHQMDASRASQTRECERLLFDAAAEMYADIIKIDMRTADAYRVVFQGVTPVALSLGQKWDDYFKTFMASVHPGDRNAVMREALCGKLESIPAGGKLRFTYRSRIKGEGYRWYTTTMRAAPAVEEQQSTATMFTVDINDEMIERARLKDLSEHDGLTDLFNQAKLEAMMETEYKDLSSCGVLFFDVNFLKKTNDTKGHEAGNALLCRVADGIRSIANRRVHGYRYGGDEFVVVACNIKEEEMDRLLNMWSTRLNTLSADCGTLNSVAVGKAWSKAPLTVGALINAADAQMYRNKARMKGAREAK